MNLFNLMAKLTLDDSAYKKTLKDSKGASEQTTKSMRSQVMKLAHEYKKQGMTMSEAMKKAHSEIEKQTGKSVGGAKKKVGLLGKAFEALKNPVVALGGVMAGVFAVDSIVGFGKEVLSVGINYNTMAEQSEIAWSTLLGTQEQAADMMERIKNFAATTPFDKMGVDAMAKQLHNAGLSGDDLFNQLTKFGDMGGAFGVQSSSLQEMVRQYAQVMQSGTAYTEDLNILQDRGIPIYKALSEQLGVSVADVRKLTSEGKISAQDYQKALDSIAKDVEGGMKKQSESFGGMVSTMKDGFNELAGTLTKPIFDFLKQAVADILPKLEQFNKTLGEEGLKAAFLELFPSAAPLVSVLGTVYGILSSTIGFVIEHKDAFLLLASAVAGGVLAYKGFLIIQTLIGFFKSFDVVLKLTTASQWLLNVAMSANPIGIVIFAIGALVGAFLYLWTTSEGFRNFWINLWNKVKEIASNSIQAVKGFFTETIPALVENVKKWFTDMKDRVIEKFREWKNKVVQFGSEMWSYLSSNVPRWIEGIINWFKQLPGKLWSALKEAVNKTIQWGRDMLTQGKRAASETVTGIITKLKELPGKVVSVGKDIVKGIWNGIVGAKNWIFGKISGFVSGMVKKFKSSLGIGSPSKVMADEVGYDVGTGISMGLNKSMKSVEANLNANVDSLVNMDVKRNATPNGMDMMNGTPILQPLISIENFYNNTEKDIKEIADELAFYLRNRNVWVK